MLCLANGTMRASSILHRTLLHGLLKAPMGFFMITPTGRLLSRFSSDIDTIDYKLPMHTKLSLIQIFRVCDPCDRIVLVDDVAYFLIVCFFFD